MVKKIFSCWMKRTLMCYLQKYKLKWYVFYYNMVRPTRETHLNLTL